MREVQFMHTGGMCDRTLRPHDPKGGVFSPWPPLWLFYYQSSRSTTAENWHERLIFIIYAFDCSVQKDKT